MGWVLIPPCVRSLGRLEAVVKVDEEGVVQDSHHVRLSAISWDLNPLRIPNHTN